MNKVYVQIFGQWLPGFITARDGEMWTVAIKNSNNVFCLTDYEFNRFCRYAD